MVSLIKESRMKAPKEGAGFEIMSVLLVIILLYKINRGIPDISLSAGFSASLL